MKIKRECEKGLQIYPSMRGAIVTFRADESAKVIFLPMEINYNPVSDNVEGS